MATLTEGGWFERLVTSRRGQADVSHVQQPTRVDEFTEQAHRKNGGPTPDLKRVYQAYLDNQRKSPG